MNKHKGRIFWPSCSVCMYMKRNPPFRQQVMDSSYFDPQGSESLAEVIKRWGNPFSMPTVYSHMRRHQSKDTRAIDVLAPVEAIPISALEETVVSSTPHERALDEIIVKGREAVRSGQLKVTGQMLNTAIKTKAEIEKSTKDRRLDAIKTFFLGDNPQEGENGASSDPNPSET